MLVPYYTDDYVTLYHGDCREILPQIEQKDTCIVDPVWPNSVFPDVADPAALFAEAAALLTVERLIIHLGCMSDPRFLCGVPSSLKFLRVCWLEYAHPSYVGRILMGSDVAYAYGYPPTSRPGRRVLPGRCMARKNDNKTQHTGRGNGTSTTVNYEKLAHPSPRRYEHVSWLVATFANEGVIDPFSGTGTTLVAAKNHGLKAVGIEREERFCEIAAGRLEQSMLALA
jgi:site-specific DNA-methyltransferase (adenine-specific)